MKKPAKNGASGPVAHAENSPNSVRAPRPAVRKQARKKPDVLPNGRERLRATIEASVDCIISIDAQSTILEFNAAAERTFGYAREEVLGKPLTETIIPRSLRDAHLRGMTALLNGGESKLLGRRVEMRAMRADGSEFPVELTITRITSEIFTAYLRDITERKRAEEELSNSLALLRAITEGTTDAVFAKDRQGRYLVANTATAQFVGKSSEQVIGLDDTALFAPETAARIMERDRAVLDSGETRTDEDVGTTVEGIFRVYLTTKGPLRDSSGAINGVFGIARDITNRKRAEEALRQADDRSRLVIDTIPTMAWRLRPDGAVDFVNQRWLEYTGLCLPDAHRDSTRIVHPDDLPSAVEKWQPVMAAGTPHEDEIRFRRADGKYRWFLIRISPQRDAAGNIVNWYGAAVDIEDRKQAEMRTRTLIDAIPHQIWSGPADGSLDYCNARWRSYMGIGLKDLQGDGWQSMLHPNDRERVLKAWHDAVANGSHYQQEERHLGADGNYRWFLARAVPLRDAEGRIVRWYGTNTDIEDRKRIEEALRKSEKLFAAFMDHLPGFAWMKDAEGRYVYINKKGSELDAYRDGVIGKTDAELWPADIASAHRANDQEVIARRKAVQTVEPSLANGERSHMLVSKFPIFDHDGSVMMVAGAGVDITDLTQAKDALNAQALRYQTLMATSTDSIYVLDEKGDLQEANAAFLRQRGYTAAEVKGLNVADWDAQWSPEKLRERLRGLRESGAVFETRHRCKDGSLFDVEVCASGVRIAGEQLFFCVTRDITERKQAEARLRRSEEKFKTLFGIAPVGISVLDRQHNVIDANPALEQITRLRKEELLNGTHRQRRILNADGTPMLPHEFPSERAITENRPVNNVEAGIVTENGEIIWVQVSVAPLALPDASAVVITQDITERKRAEEELTREKEILAKIFNNIPVMIGFVGDDGGVRLVNPEWERTMGWTLKELRDQNVNIFAEAYPDLSYRQEVLNFVAAATGEWADLKIKVRDGHVVDAACAIVHLSDGTKIAIAQDITERKLAEERLREYEKVVEGLEEMIVVVDRDYRYLLANRAFLAFRSLEREQLIGRLVPDVLGAEAFAGVAGKLSECLAGKTIQYEMGYRFPDNSERDLLVSYLPIEGPGGIDRVACVLQDITERKRTEQARERGLSLMLATLESTADGILVVNTEGKIETFNRLFARMWRLPDEVLASNEDARALECVLDQLVEPEKFMEKVTYLYCHPEEESFDHLVFKDGRVFERYSRPQLIGGKVAGRVWSFRDITERNQAREALQKANRQLRSLSRRLFQVQEQEKRHLARELHDEIGQALTAVKINLTSLGTANSDNSLRLEETIALLDNLLRQVRQISLDLHPSLLDDLGLAAALRSLLDQQARRAGLRAQFCATQFTDNIDVAISSTAFRIAQEAITNVLRHAKASFIKVQLQTEAGRLRIEVVDDGAGFDVAEARQRGHQEAGFGLMGMKERAALVGGEVEVTSARDTGTRVQISLPLKENGSTA